VVTAAVVCAGSPPLLPASVVLPPPPPQPAAPIISVEASNADTTLFDVLIGSNSSFHLAVLLPCASPGLSHRSGAVAG